MAKPIVVSLGGKESSFDLAKLDRAKIYGRRTRVPLDREGHSCERAALTEDGRVLLRPGMTAQGYFDDAGRWVPNNELVGLDAEGQPLPKIDSTLGVSQALERVEPEVVLDLDVMSVYLLSPLALDSALQAELEAGALYRFSFNYGADYRAESAVLLHNAEGFFALVGQPAPPVFLGFESAVEPTVAEEEAESDELDFDMF